MFALCSTFIAYTRPLSFFRTCMTLPKLPFPNTLSNKKSFKSTRAALASLSSHGVDAVDGDHPPPDPTPPAPARSGDAAGWNGAADDDSTGVGVCGCTMARASKGSDTASVKRGVGPQDYTGVKNSPKKKHQAQRPHTHDRDATDPVQAAPRRCSYLNNNTTNDEKPGMAATKVAAQCGFRRVHLKAT